MPKAPNLILLMTDQHRADGLGIAGHPVLQTPNLDHLAASGALFTAAFTECPVCIPARHTLMTGMAPERTGCVGYAQRQRIADSTTTLPELLRRAGYQTAMIGRDMHQYPPLKRYGFETILPGTPYADRYSRVPAPSHALGAPGAHGLGFNDARVHPWTEPEAHHESTHTVTRALEWLEARDPEAPFFLSVGFVAPHPPLCPLPFFYERYRAQALPEAALGTWAHRPEHEGLGLSPHGFEMVLEGTRRQETQAAYLALINQVDHQLHRLLHRLRREPDTYILFTSDHGEMLGDHYRWQKSQPYQGAVNIPFLLSGPGLARRQVSSASVGLQDVLPTFCELAGVPVPEHVTGRSVLGALRGEPWREWIHGELAQLHDVENGGHLLHPGFHYLANAEWKYIWFNDGREQLFHLAADPRELNDLAPLPTHAATLALWRDRLVQKLRERPEGFSDGARLIAGCEHRNSMPHAVVD
jgi:arylsulfatase